MSDYNSSHFAKSFESFTNYLELFEASTLSSIGLPDDFMKAVHTKKEPISSDYPLMGHTYRKGVAIPMPYWHYAPGADMPIPEPVVLKGRLSNNFSDSPVSRRVEDQNDASRKSIGGDGYTDLAWYLEALPIGVNRVFLVNKEIGLFLYVYDKQRTKGATGFQYGVMGWDPTEEKVIDFGYGELTTNAVDRKALGPQHDTKGGNTNGKVGQYLSKVASLSGKGGAPTVAKPIYAYDFGIHVPGEKEAFTTRKEREEEWAVIPGQRETRIKPQKGAELKATKGPSKFKGNLLSTDFLRLVAEKLSKLNLSKDQIDRLLTLPRLSTGRDIPLEFGRLAEKIGDITDSEVYSSMFMAFRDFRKELFEEGRGRTEGAQGSYRRTIGVDLEGENKDISRYGLGSAWNLKYAVDKKLFSPDEESYNPEKDYREAQPSKYKRYLPTAGGYASIQSLVARHSLDGLMSLFLGYLFTGKIRTSAQVPLLTSWGITGTDKEDPFSTSREAGPGELEGLF